MDEWIGLADAAMRSVPILWVGPNAAGHLKPPSQILSQGNNALWHFTLEMAKEARAREVEALSMYNLTLQATSWDGTGYGQKVALVQAMMVSWWKPCRRDMNLKLMGVTDYQLAVEARLDLSRFSSVVKKVAASCLELDRFIR